MYPGGSTWVTVKKHTQGGLITLSIEWVSWRAALSKPRRRNPYRSWSEQTASKSLVTDWVRPTGRLSGDLSGDGDS